MIIHDLDTIQDADAGVGLPEQRDGWMAWEEEKRIISVRGTDSGGARKSVPRLGLIRFFVVRGMEIRAPPWFYKVFRRAGHGNPCPALVL